MSGLAAGSRSFNGKTLMYPEKSRAILNDRACDFKRVSVMPRDGQDSHPGCVTPGIPGKDSGSAVILTGIKLFLKMTELMKK